jgi:hypothetical protein
MTTGEHFAESLDAIGDAGLTRLAADVFAAQPFRSRHSLSGVEAAALEDALDAIAVECGEMRSLVEHATRADFAWVASTRAVAEQMRERFEAAEKDV